LGEEAVNLDEITLKQGGKVSHGLETLKAIRQFSQDKITYGLQHVDRYVEDVEGNWLENWAEEDSENLSPAFKE
jgi:hypothetical protein